MDTLTPDQYDQAYNNQALVPDFLQYLQRWAADSKAVRDSQPCLTDLRYGSGPQESLDIFTTAHAKAPVLVFLHGGYWRALDKSDFSFVAPALTEQGVCVVVPNYALCPAVTIPQIVMQMVKAVAWVWRYLQTWGGDSDRIHLAGHSAGGHLIAMLMGCDWRSYAADLPPNLLKTSLAVSGLYELDSVRMSPQLQKDLRLDDKQVMACSPAWMVPPINSQLYSVVGGLESEAFLSHNQLIQNAWGRQCVPLAQVIPDLNHFSIMDAFAQRGHPLNQLVCEISHSDH